MDNLLNRLRRTGVVFLAGSLLIVYIALGILYWQQAPRQRNLEDQIAKATLVLAKPLPGAEKLKADYETVNLALTPLSVPAALDIIVSIAQKNGIDVNPGSGKFNIPPPGALKKETVGQGNYEVLPLAGIRAQGEYDKVMAFIAELDTGKTLKTMVLKTVDVKTVEVVYKDEEETRRTEFRNVAAAVKAMMADNKLTLIPDPMSYGAGAAANYMGDNPATPKTVEGFPNTIITTADKGYTGTGTPRAGYVLYRHDKTGTDTTTFTTVSYLDIFKTKYYYTAEADGKVVRQFDGPNVGTATEYLGSEPSKTETLAILQIDFYSKAKEEPKPKEEKKTEPAPPPPERKK